MDFITIAIAFFALSISYFAMQHSKTSAKAAIYDQRFAVYSDAEKYISIWLRDGEPDMQSLYLIVGAWSRSHFLYDQEVTDYLRKIWTDSTRANLLRSVINNSDDPEREQAIEEAAELSSYHSDYERLRDVFLPTLKLESARPLLRRFGKNNQKGERQDD